MQICESDFSPLRASDDAVCPKAHKEELVKNGGTQRFREAKVAYGQFAKQTASGRKDAFSLVGTGPNISDTDLFCRPPSPNALGRTTHVVLLYKVALLCIITSL